MNALLEWQRSMRAQLSGAPADAVSAFDERLAIYRHTCVTTLSNALSLSYPAVRRLLGDDCFEGAARQFLAAHPPRSAYLNLYGAPFAQFLAQLAPLAALTYLPDVARLEWAVNRALHARDAAGLDLARLSTLSDESTLRLRFHARPDVSVLCLDWPADEIWRAVLANDDAALSTVRLDAGPVHLLIERTAGAVEVQRLAPAAARFLEALLRGQVLGAVLIDGGAEEDFTALLGGHLQAGRFTDFNTADEAADTRRERAREYGSE